MEILFEVNTNMSGSKVAQMCHSYKSNLTLSDILDSGQS